MLLHPLVQQESSLIFLTSHPIVLVCVMLREGHFFMLWLTKREHGQYIVFAETDRYHGY
jgi:hypothetical protein